MSINPQSLMVVSRVTNQMTEFTVQKTKIKEMLQMVESRKESMRQHSALMEKLSSYQAKLTTQFEAALQLAMGQHTPQLSKYEKLFIDEIQKTDHLMQDSLKPKFKKVTDFKE
jgi:K+/H+ antiporter YhaU regulatory subunit KhtT